MVDEAGHLPRGCPASPPVPGQAPEHRRRLIDSSAFTGAAAQLPKRVSRTEDPPPGTASAVDTARAAPSGSVWQEIPGPGRPRDVWPLAGVCTNLFRYQQLNRFWLHPWSTKTIWPRLWPAGSSLRRDLDLDPLGPKELRSVEPKQVLRNRGPPIVLRTPKTRPHRAPGGTMKPTP